MINIREFKNEVKGRIFTVTFMKLNGEKRVMKARFGVKRELTGDGLKYDAEAAGNLIVFDLEKGAYRTVKCENILYLNYNKKKIVTHKAFFDALS
jgi:predicted nucleic-acid-binding Zn-ribbon protein